MDKTYEKVSDTEGTIVETVSTTVTLADLQVKATELANQISSYNAQKDEMTTGYNSNIANIDANIADVQAQLDAVNADIAGLQAAGVTTLNDEQP